MVCIIANVAFEDHVVATEVKNSSRGLGDCDEAHETLMQDPNLGFQ